MALWSSGSQTIIPDGRRPAPDSPPGARSRTCASACRSTARRTSADRRGQRLSRHRGDGARRGACAIDSRQRSADRGGRPRGDLRHRAYRHARARSRQRARCRRDGVAGSGLLGGPDAQALDPSDVMVHPRSSCEVLVQSDTIEEFKTVLGDAAERTRQFNPRMKDKVERDGIFDPLLCQLMHVQTTDGHSAIALVTRDGSTRCSFAQIAHGHDPHDALFGALRDAAVRRDRWQAMKRRFESPAASIEPSTSSSNCGHTSSPCRSSSGFARRSRTRRSWTRSTRSFGGPTSRRAGHGCRSRRATARPTRSC